MRAIFYFVIAVLWSAVLQCTPCCMVHAWFRRKKSFYSGYHVSESHVLRTCIFKLFSNTDNNSVQIKLNFWNWKTFSLLCFWKALESYLEIINFEWISPKSWFSSPLKSRSQIYPQIKTTIIDSQPTHHYRKRFHKIGEENRLFNCRNDVKNENCEILSDDFPASSGKSSSSNLRF